MSRLGLDKLLGRALSFAGIDLDFSISASRAPFNQITKQLFLGSRPTRDRIGELQAAGITHVVSCLNEADRTAMDFLQEHFPTLFIPLRDGIEEDIASSIPAFLDFADMAQKQQRRAKVLVHCEVGVSRSASLAIALVMQQSKQPFFEAYCDVRSKRREVLPNIGFASQLQQLEFQLQPNRRIEHSTSSLTRYLHEVCMVPIDRDTLQTMLHSNNYDALTTIKAIFGNEIPRVIQGVRM